MFSFENIRSLHLEIPFPKGKTKLPIEEIFGNIPLKNFYLKGYSNSAFFRLLDSAAPRLDFTLGEANISIFKEKIVVNVRSREKGSGLRVQGVSPSKHLLKEDPFSETALSRISSDLNFLIGVAMSELGKKEGSFRAEGSISLFKDAPPADFNSLFSISPDKAGLSQGKFTGGYVEFQDKLFDSLAKWTIDFSLASREEGRDTEKPKELRARTEFEADLSGPIDLMRLCKKQIEVTEQTFTKLGVT